MKHSPLRSYPAARYPTKQETRKQPDLLKEHVPRRWRQNGEMGALLALLVASTNCGGPPTGAIKSKDTSARLALVAPVFAHGEGIGATGCVAVSPPTFLSEPEAMVIICDELKQHGVELTRKNAALPQAVVHHDASLRAAGEYIHVKASNRPLLADGYSPDKKLAVEFISEDDCFDFGQKDSSSTVQDYNYRKAAETLRKRLAADATSGKYAVFYAPAQQNKKVSTDLLRAQVKDFVDWLKGQGAI